MMTTDLGACEWFVWDLRRSNLIDRGQLDQIIGEFLNKNPGAEPPAMADYLVRNEFLTDFQAERLLQGKTQGFVLGPFTLKDALGAGSMGTVYRAVSKTDNKEYAVKVLPRRSMWNVRIARRKVRAFEQAKHPAVVPFVDVGTAGGMHYLAWPLVEGETMERMVFDNGPLSVEETIQYALQTLKGLEVCHQQGLFHGLLKPSNLMIDKDGQVRILDFGIGSLLAETEGESLVDTMSTANSVNSGLDCASPESIMDPSNLTPIGDQYSLGCSLYFCLAGQYPFPEGTAVEKMMCHQMKQPTPLSELSPTTPPELIAVIERLMEKDPANRFESTPDVVEALRPFAGAALPRRPENHSRALPPLSRPTNVSTPTPLPSSERPLPPIFPSAEQPVPQAIPQPPAAMPAPQPAPIEQPWEQHPQFAQPQAPQPTWDQRLGPIGVGLIAVLAGAAAWLLSSMFN